MRSVLYSLCYLDGVDGFGSNRLERNIRYLKYYQALKDKLGFEKIVLADNASCPELIQELLRQAGPDVEIHRFEEHIPRKSLLDYGYCWRGLHNMHRLIEAGYEKIIAIDSDAFVLSHRLADWIREKKDGWWTVWCEKYKMPESAFQILCKPAFPTFERFTEVDWRSRNGTLMEMALPYFVHMGFKSSRWGEDKIPQHPSMDLYCQTPLDIPLEFGKYEST